MTSPPPSIGRRRFLACTGQAAIASAAGLSAPDPARSAEVEGFRLRYLLSTAMFGRLPLAEILPEVARTGSEGLDLWGEPHGSQREEVDAMGVDAFAELLGDHGVELVVSTRYPLGPFGLQPEMPVVKQLGGKIIVCGTTGPSEPAGDEAKKAVRAFLDKMKPQVAAAGEHGLVIAVENHDRQLLYHPDSLRWFAEFNDSPHLGIAFALHHLHAFADEIPALIRDLGNAQIPFIYFQEHSEGIRRKVAKEIEMQQMPGFGGALDYRPIIAALRAIEYRGHVEIFMHPTPRGVPILPTVPAITAAINRSREYLERCLEETA